MAILSQWLVVSQKKCGMTRFLRQSAVRDKLFGDKITLSKVRNLVQLIWAASPGHCASLCLQAARRGCAAGGSGQWRKAH